MTTPQEPDTPDSDFDELHLPNADHILTGDDETDSEGPDENLPFSSVYNERLDFRSINRAILVPGVDVLIQILDVTKTPHNIINPYLYVIQVKHGKYQWTIQRRYRHFHHLHMQLKLFYKTLHLPLPMKRIRERRKTLRMNRIDQDRKPPRFPSKTDGLIREDRILARMKQLEDYLQTVLKIPLYSKHPAMLEFLEISEFSFVEDLGLKRKEGTIKKRAGGHRTFKGLFFCCFVCRNWCSHFSSRWLILKDTFLAYVHQKSGHVHFVMLMDRAFEVQTGLYQTGIKNGLLISNLTRRLLLKCPSVRSTKEWFEAIIEVAKATGKDFIQPNRFNSYAPVRDNTNIHWYIDGIDYYEDVAVALEAAEDEIFITDWWLSPEVFLKRPSIDGQKWRLDKVLQRKAEEGVKIFILLYKEVELAIGLNSLYTKQRLVEQHPRNIRVLRHPDIRQGTLLWAHHEKMVVIDQMYAFLGGLDLCFGRWDTQDHKLTDLGGISRQKGLSVVDTGMKAISTPNIAGFGAYNVFQLAHATQNISLAPVSKSENTSSIAQRMHDCLNPSSGVPATSTSPLLNSQSFLPTTFPSSEESFTDSDDYKETKEPRESKSRRRIHWHKRNRSLDNEDILAAKPKPSFQQVESVENITQASSEPALDQTGSMKMWIGKDYANFIARDFVNLDAPFIDLVDRTTTPRMPWHDIAISVQGKVARDVARHFIQRWNFTKAEKAKEHPAYPWLIPRSYEEFEEPEIIIERKTGTVFCQILRSSSLWSAGIAQTEDSIRQAYIHAIENSKHFIYIENQFFITLTASNKDVSNAIADALYNRIARAHTEKAPFRVYVMLPLLPSFEGEIGTNKGTAIQTITHWNYTSICRGDGSLLGRLAAIVPDPTEYISFYGLRTHDMLNNNPVTELIYVHSKLMIVDDCIAIIGSANLNDRSMLGKRDSEMAVYIEDKDMKQSTLGGGDASVGKVVGKLRHSLFKEFLGILKENPDNIDVSDPVADSFFKEIWIKTAALNTSIYEKVFHCLPTDSVRDFIQLKGYQTKVPLAVSNPELAKQMLSRIRGFLVLFPLRFLTLETLTPAPGTKEALMPTSLWV